MHSAKERTRDAWPRWFGYVLMAAMCLAMGWALVTV
jgi:hypothetical protein